MASRLYVGNFVALLVSALIAFVAIIVIPNVDVAYKLLCIINAEIAVLFLYVHPMRSYSLQKITNLFILFFFVFANAIQFSHRNIVSSISIVLTTSDYIYFQMIVLCILILFNTAYFLFDNYKIEIHESFNTYSSYRLIILSFISVILTLYFYRGDMLRLFIRGLLEETGELDFDVESQGYVGYLLFGKFIRPIPFACLLIASNFELSRKCKFVLFALMLIALFPFGLARNAVAMYWLPVLLINIKLFNKGNFFILSMLFGLLLIFPFMEIFRRWDGTFNFQYSLDFFNTMSFDSSQEFMIVMKKNVITYGNQLLGAVFFFIPRSLWPSKPVGSGAFMADKDGVFSNLSMPLWGEGYINFGFGGVILFTLVVAYICAQADKLFWLNKKIKRVFNLYYLLLVGSMLFILRGDLMSSFAYTFGTILCIYASERVALIRK